jgi:mxaA protein
VVQPRPFGYVIGDLLSQRVLLPDVDVDLAQLPVPRRVGVWWDRHAVKIERASDGRRWLRVDYQLINAPQKLATVTLPAWELESKSGVVKLAIPAWPVSVTPLTPETAFTMGGLSDIRPDRPAPVIATAPIRRELGIWSTAFGVALAAWLAWLWWRNGSAAMNQPFARALREIRALDETAPQAWQALHRAFDLTAHRVVQTDTLDSLFKSAPHLAPLRSDIEKFFAASNERFFGTARQDSGVSVRALCGELRRIEKRNER